MQNNKKIAAKGCFHSIHLFIFSRAVFRAEPQLTERTEEANVSLEIVDPRIKGAYSNCFNRMIDFFWLFGGGVIDLVDSLSS